MVLAKKLKTIGKRFRQGKMHAWEIGAMLCVFNMIILTAFGFLAMAAFPMIASWLLFFIAAPIFLAVFWLWFSQEVLHVYHQMTLHNAFLIAKLSLFPFLIMLFLATIVLVAVVNQPITWVLQLLSYNLVLFSVGCMLIGFTTIIFGLRHHFKHFF